MKRSIKWLRYIAIVGNAVFVLWIIYNAINSGFDGTMPEKASFMGLILLLSLNSYLVFAKTKKAE